MPADRGLVPLNLTYKILHFISQSPVSVIFTKATSYSQTLLEYFTVVILMGYTENIITDLQWNWLVEKYLPDFEG